MRWGVLLGSVASLLVATPSASAQDAPPDDPTVIVDALLREVCGLVWIDGACTSPAYRDPGYVADTEPDPSAPLALRVGAVHEHSGYSDGDPDTRPADYFRAAREGTNEADAGGDTGVRLDFMLSSEHSENEKLPITTAEACIDPTGIEGAIAALDLEGILPPLKCSNLDRADHYDKWDETLRQAGEATELGPDGQHVGFTAMRGFEWTNDYFNHMGVYFSRNVVNAKIDGSYVSMERMWDWLREPAARGGGDDALVVFNHPGGLPKLSPFDGGLPHSQLLQDLLGGANWNDVAYVPDVDERVAAIEVNGGDDLSWYVRALTNGWHIGPVAAEDEHQREWASSAEGKTLMLTRGRSPQDYYVALQQHRTIAIAGELVGGAPGQAASFPAVHLYADGASIQDPAATVMGSTATGAASHTINLEATGLRPGSPVVLLSSEHDVPQPLDAVDASGSVDEALVVPGPADGEAWWFAVVCPPGTTDCGTGQSYEVVTAPVWFEGTTGAAAGDGRGSGAASGPRFQLQRPELLLLSG